MDISVRSMTFCNSTCLQICWSFSATCMHSSFPHILLLTFQRVSPWLAFFHCLWHFPVEMRNVLLFVICRKISFVVVFSFVSIKKNLASAVIKQQKKNRRARIVMAEPSLAKIVICFTSLFASNLYALFDLLSIISIQFLPEYVGSFDWCVAKTVTLINFNSFDSLWMTSPVWIHLIEKLASWLEHFAMMATLWSLHVFSL